MQRVANLANDHFLQPGASERKRDTRETLTVHSKLLV